MINVTKTYLPDKEKYKRYIDEIFESGWLTNNGRLLGELERRLREYLGVKNLLLVSNGTVALQVAYKVLELKGDVLTTPFSFVATTSSLVWEGLNPIFVDIDKRSLNVDPANIQKSISSKTSAIVATHVYSNACDIDSIEKIAKEKKLKVIYDAAHAFDVRYKNNNILNYGDISTISFHSTKTFHTIEGGALVIKDDKLFEKAKTMINFGIKGPSEILGLGINAKMNEFQAAMGLCVLDEIEEIKANRRTRYEYYLDNLENTDGLTFQMRNEFATNNFTHFPVIFQNEGILLKVIEELNNQNIYPRRYFYPSLESLPYINITQTMENSNDIARRVLCLPLFHSLEKQIQDRIIKTIKIVLK
ncbi:DegT/DnrJ/EryC1/StrS family aminotransferase [Paenibacillus elgii]